MLKDKILYYHRPVTSTVLGGDKTMEVADLADPLTPQKHGRKEPGLSLPPTPVFYEPPQLLEK